MQCFITDFTVIFNLIEWFFRRMEGNGVPEKTIRLKNIFHRHILAQAYIYVELTDPFEIRTVVCQDCAPNNIQLCDRLDNG